MDADHDCKQEDRFVRLMVSASHSTRSLQSSYKQLWNKKSHSMHSSLSYMYWQWHHPSQTAATFRPHCKVWTWNGSPLCSLETASRATKTDMDSNCRSETCQHWSAHRVAASAKSCWLEELHFDSYAPLGACYWWWWWWWALRSSLVL